MSAYRQDPRWQAAQADYVAEHEDLNAEADFVQRTMAAFRMYEIEYRDAA
jgi:hypothetical protein